VTGRRLLMWNADVEISLCRPSGTMDYFFRNGEGDEVIFVHEGSGVLETTFGDVPYKQGDYVVVPRGTTYRFQPAQRPSETASASGPGGGGSAADASSHVPQRYLVFETPGLIEIPRRYRNQYGQIMEGAPYYHRDIHPPTELRTVREKGEFPVKVRVRDGYQTYVLDYHPFDVVGWDGYLYPWTFSIHDFEPITGRIHQPPPSHQTFAGPNFVICSFCPRKLDFDPLAVPIPYHHSNLQSEEMIYYVSGNFGSRKGVETGSITLHPSGLPHGPQPGLAEKSIGTHETHELAVMCDTFNPLKLTKFAKDLDDGKYAYSWYENSLESASVDGDATGAGLTSHL
jgi:homogentisate 1,2-dioxygenase